MRKLLAIVRALLQKHRMNKLKYAIINSKHNVLFVKNAYDARKYGFSLSDSILYSFPKNDYREYISTWEAYQPRISNNRNFVISDDKFLFSTVMKNFVDVPRNFALIKKGDIYSVCDNNLNKDTLYDFLLEQNGGVIKDRGGFNGFNVFVFGVKNGMLTRCDSPVSHVEFNALISAIDDGLVQNRISQGSFENKLYNKAINTIRIITMQKKDGLEHEIVAALQRIGTDRTNGVDNFAQGGGTALIDIDTGILSKMTMLDSFDEDGNRIFYSHHPDSGAIIEGVVIPRWEEIKNTIIEITRRLPIFEYVAWDVVVKDDGIAVIETNMKSSLDVFQVHGGFKNKFLGQKYKEHGYIKD